MTESYTFKDVYVECYISDYGQLSMTIVDAVTNKTLVFVIPKQVSGKIPWPSVVMQEGK